MTPVLREAMLSYIYTHMLLHYIYAHICYIYIYVFFEPRRCVASNSNKRVPRRVCGYLLKACLKPSCSGYLLVMYYISK